MDILKKSLNSHGIPDDIIKIIHEYMEFVILNDKIDDVINELEKNINNKYALTYFSKHIWKKVILKLFKNQIYSINFVIDYKFTNINVIRIGKCKCCDYDNERNVYCLSCYYGTINIKNINRNILNYIIYCYENILLILKNKYKINIIYQNRLTKEYLKQVKNIFKTLYIL